MAILVKPDSDAPSKTHETTFREQVEQVTKVLKTVTGVESEEWQNALRPETVCALKALQKEIKEWGF
jgi:hypothetical protein